MFSALVVLVTALGVLVDGEVLVRRMQTLVPARRRGGADRMGRIVYATFGSYFAGSLFVAVLAGLVTLSAGLLLGVPLAPVAGAVDHLHQPHPADRRVRSAARSSCCWR